MYSTKDVLVKKSEPETEMEKSHQQGSTASFAIKETFDKIYAKLESAERKQTLGFGKKVQEKKTVNDFQPIKEEEESEEEFRKPVSGRSSRSMKKAAPKTPVRQQPVEEDEFLLQS